MSCHRLLVASATAAALALSLEASARADGPAQPDATQPETPPSHAIDRTWLYADDARVPAPLTVIGMSNFSYTNVGSSPTRIASAFPTGTGVYSAFASNTAQPGAMVAVGGELGLVDRLSLMALGQMALGGDDTGVNAGAVAGLRFSIFPSSWLHAHLVASAGYLREAWTGPVYDDDTGKWLPGSSSGSNGAWIQLAVSGDVDRLRLAGTFHGEHIFSDGRDPLDVMVNLGASYRLVERFRLGAEYVGQDLEESFSPGAEGGARHFLGPTASVQLFDERLTLVAGPAIGLSQSSPAFVGRFALAYGF